MESIEEVASFQIDVETKSVKNTDINLPSNNILTKSINELSAGENNEEYYKGVGFFKEGHTAKANAELSEGLPMKGNMGFNEGPSMNGNGKFNNGPTAKGHREKKKEQTNILTAVQKLREQRIAREQARLEKIRQMNVLKYKNNDGESAHIISKPNLGNNIRKSCAGHIIPKPSVERNILKQSAGHTVSKPNSGLNIPKTNSGRVTSKPNVINPKSKVGSHSKTVAGDVVPKNADHLSKLVKNSIQKHGTSKQNTEDGFTKPTLPLKTRMSSIPTYNKPLLLTNGVSIASLKPTRMSHIPSQCSTKTNTDHSSKWNFNNKIEVKKDLLFKNKVLPPKNDTAKKGNVTKNLKENIVPKVPTACVKPMLSNDQIQRSKVPPQNRVTLSTLHRKSIIPKLNTNVKKSEPVPGKKKWDVKIPDPSSHKKISQNECKPHITDVRQALFNQVHGVEQHLTQKLSVFDRLSKPKHVTNKVLNTPHETKRFSQFTRKTPNINARHSLMPAKSKPLGEAMMRRSISSVHFKRLPPNQHKRCIHRSSSVSDALNRKQIDEINEDDEGEDDIVYAVKSERKKTVKFSIPHTPGYSINTPRPADLRMKLANWLHTKGRSINSYQHLQCFGIHNVITKPKVIPMADIKQSDDENKENVEISDDASFTDNLEDRQTDFDDNSLVNDLKDEQINYNNRDFGIEDKAGNWNKWRRASYQMSDTLSTSVDLCEEFDGSQIDISPEDNTVPEIMIGALTDLLNLIREGYEGEQCARWLRAVREHYPASTECALYWECRAALEEQRGNFPRTLECWEQAIIQGVKPSTVEASLDQLLDKFMKLKLSPNSAKTSSTTDLKLLDVKNIFKSTLIRFAVQQKRIRESQTKLELAKFTATPVRRSSRLNTVSPNLANHRESFKLQVPQVVVDHKETDKTPITPENEKPLPKLTKSSKRTPLVQICSSLQQIDEDVRKTLVFVPNKALQFNDGL